MQALNDAVNQIQAELSSKPELLERLQLVKDAATSKERLDQELRQVLSAKDAEVARLRGEVNRIRAALSQASSQIGGSSSTAEDLLQATLTPEQKAAQQAERAQLLQSAVPAANTAQGEIIALKAKLDAQVAVCAHLEAELSAAGAASRAQLAAMQDSYASKVADMRRAHAAALAQQEARLTAAAQAGGQAALKEVQAELASTRQQLCGAQEQVVCLSHRLEAQQSAMAEASRQHQVALGVVSAARDAAQEAAAAAREEVARLTGLLQQGQVGSESQASVGSAGQRGGSQGSDVDQGALQGMLSMMEGQLRRLSELVRSKDAEILELRRAVQAGCEERRELSQQLQALSTGSGNGSAAAPQGQTSPRSPTGGGNHPGRLTGGGSSVSLSKPYRTGLTSKPRFK